MEVEPGLMALARVMISLIFVLALCLVVLRFVLPRFTNLTPPRGKMLQVLEVTSLDRQTKVAVVRVKDREYLVGFGGGQARRLGSWRSSSSLEEATRSAEERRAS